MSKIQSDKQPMLDMASLTLGKPSAPSRSASPTNATSRSSSPQGKARRPSLTLPGLPARLVVDTTPAAHRALTQPHIAGVSSLAAPSAAARAQSTGQVSQVEGPNPSTTFGDLRAALPDAEGAASHISTAKALAIVIETGAEGLKTVFGYDDKGHVVFGSHDELEQSKSKSTQHAQLLQRIGRSMKTDKSLDAESMKFGGQLFLAGMSRGANAPKGVSVGGTRLKQQQDGSLKFTVSDSFGFNKVTSEVLEPVAQFHANVLRLSGLVHKEIQGDGQATDVLAKRVSELLG